MIYTSKEKLAILELEETALDVSFDTLSELIMNRPSNMIYCEKNGMLYGIISMGDINRAAKNGYSSVTINTNFTCILEHEYMRARKLFHDNEKINALPIVNEKNELIGAYARWEDWVAKYNFEYLRNNKYAKLYWQNIKRIGMVNPDEQFSQKKVFFAQAKELFDELGIMTETIDRHDLVNAFKKNDIVFFVDEDEIRGLDTLYKDILQKDLKRSKAKTLSDISNAISNVIGYTIGDAFGDTIGDAILRKIMEKGVSLITIQVKQKDNDYWKTLNKDLNDKFLNIGKKRQNILYKEFWEDFFDELYSYEYAKEIVERSIAISKKKLILSLKDTETEYYNVKNGERLTIGQPTEYEKSIYFFGACIAIGERVEDSHTIESYLQNLLNRDGYRIRVVNYGCWADNFLLLQRICSTDFKKGDIAIVLNINKSFDGIPNIDLGQCLEQQNISAKWFVDHPNHGNYKVNKLWAETIYDFLQNQLSETASGEKAEKVQIPNDQLTSAYIERYFSNYTACGAVGSIVMNCNPFTNGHRYLIEQALKKVDHLIIFVVEEDKSVFTFKERFAMVIEGTKDLENITVVPSGNFILSQKTFPEYFLKIEDEDVTYNAEFDITLFAEGIAPKLNITYRFVGEEKEDNVTNEYNLAMKKILPQHGIQVFEIPRKTVDDSTDRVISATSVRKKLEESNLDDITDLVPQSTREILLPSWE